MKKLLLSGGVIALFLLYGWHQQQEAGNVQVGIPSQQQSSPSDSLTAPSTQGDAGNGNLPTTPTTSQSTGPANPSTSGQYKDGAYTGGASDAFYGNIQVQATIQGGKLTNVNFLQYPNDRGTSIMINQQAMPYLKQEAIQAQSANVDIVSGATDSSMAFRQSLASALSQAH